MFLDQAGGDISLDGLARLTGLSLTMSKVLHVTPTQFTPRLPAQVETLNMFHLFPSLPFEIRQHIFRLSLPLRVLTVTYDTQKNRFSTSTSPPVLLRVSHEARIAALRIYSLSFGTVDARPRIYFNPYLDTLYLPRHGDMGYDESFRDFKTIVSDSSGMMNQLRRVAIDHVDIDVKRPWEGYNKASFLRGFKNLEKIELIVDNDTEIQISRSGNEIWRFTTPTLSPEQQLKMWWYFRQGFAAEEDLLAEMCAEMGIDYEAFVLPMVCIRGKCLEYERADDYAPDWC